MGRMSLLSTLFPGLVTHKAPKNIAYGTYETRLKSFENWPRENHMDVRELAQAGFYWSKDRDIVICFSCGGGLVNFEAHDIPIVEHIKHHSTCSFIRRTVTLNGCTGEKPSSDGAVCAICHTNAINISMLGCGHTSCSQCVCSLTRCHVCRGLIIGTFKIYL